ncbi:MAG TPA: alpha/beta fold hydrolase [Casimicrobiaceae bacterium]|nr:alpha/beta fold hydrolase [Casimicrobiaceae bacterium]
MTALITITLLVAGVWAYVRWAAHSIAHGVSVWWFVAGAPVAYLAPAIILTAAWFAAAWLWRTPRPPQTRLDLAGSVRLYVLETLTLAGSWPLLALHRLIIHDPPPAHATRPVLLIHGVLVNDGVWFWFRRRLQRLGIGPIYSLNYGPPHASIERFAQQLNAKIRAVCAATGATQVVLIGHSMGGLVARAYLRRCGGGQVQRLITIGTPHHGSILAWSFPGIGLAQMHPGSAWLAKLNEAEDGPPPVPITSIWSRHDSMVIPQASATLAGGENIAIVGVGHNALLSDESVARMAASVIEGSSDAAR